LLSTTYSQINDVKTIDIDKPNRFALRSPVRFLERNRVMSTNINLTKRRIFVYQPKKKMLRDNSLVSQHQIMKTRSLKNYIKFEI